MNQKAGHPFADKNVRAAFSYAFDRQKFLNDIVKPFDPTVQMLNCAVWVPGVGNWCDNTQFADIQPDPAKVSQYMTASGYAKDSSGIWAKGGKELTIKWMVNSGNQRREDTQAEFIPLLAKQGFKLSTDNSSANSVFQQRLPTGDYDLGMFIEVTSPDPSVTSIMACDSIPGPANQGQGQNQWWWCNQQATTLIHASDNQLDVSKRTTQIHQIGQYIRDDFVTLPLYAFPAMVAYRTDKLDGPIDAYINNPESVFFNLYAWSIK
jgi:peptide/nickel transport system substrate-binding protein